jgi:hypothetical protein
MPRLKELPPLIVKVTTNEESYEHAHGEPASRRHYPAGAEHRLAGVPFAVLAQNFSERRHVLEDGQNVTRGQVLAYKQIWWSEAKAANEILPSDVDYIRHGGWRPAPKPVVVEGPQSSVPQEVLAALPPELAAKQKEVIAERVEQGEKLRVLVGSKSGGKDVS